MTKKLNFEEIAPFFTALGNETRCMYSIDGEVKEILLSMKGHLKRFSKVINQCKTCY